MTKATDPNRVGGLEIHEWRKRSLAQELPTQVDLLGNFCTTPFRSPEIARVVSVCH
jgi:hypothetical protein